MLIYLKFVIKFMVLFISFFFVYIFCNNMIFVLSEIDSFCGKLFFCLLFGGIKLWGIICFGEFILKGENICVVWL